MVQMIPDSWINFNPRMDYQIHPLNSVGLMNYPFPNFQCIFVYAFRSGIADDCAGARPAVLGFELVLPGIMRPLSYPPTLRAVLWHTRL